MKFYLRRPLFSRRRSGREILDFLCEATYLGALFAVPLYFAYLPATYHAFELNKLALLEAAVWLLLVLVGARAIFYPVDLGVPGGHLFRRYWLWPLLLVAALGLAAAGADHLPGAYFGRAERGLGWRTYSLLLLWFLLLSYYFLARWRAGGASASGLLRRVAVAVSLSATTAAGYAILQYLAIDFVAWTEPPYLTQRSFSTLGQPNFLASWLLLTWPVAGYLAWGARAFLSRFAWALASLFQLVAIFMTGSRGGVIALIIVIMLGAAYYFRRLVSRPGARAAGIAGGLLAIALMILALNSISPGRVEEIARGDYGSLGARLNFYEAAAAAIADRPWLGYGLENGSEVFIRHYEPDWAVYGDVGQSADRAHNLILDILLAGGALGLVAYIFFYHNYFRLAANNFFSGREARLSLALGTGAAAYLLSLFLSFSFISGELYFWTFLALLVGVAARGSAGSPLPELPGVDRRPGREWARRGLWLLIIILVAGHQGYRAAKTWTADYYFRYAAEALAAADYPTALVINDYIGELAPNPANREVYDRRLGEVLSEAYPELADSPLGFWVRRELAAIDGRLGRPTYSNLIIRAKINRALGDYSRAAELLDELMAVSPRWPHAWMEQGHLLASRGEDMAAIAAYEQAAALLPLPDDERLNDDHRRKVLDFRSRLSGWRGGIYLRRGDQPAARRAYQQAYADNPKDYTLLKDIADSYYLEGNFEAAIRYCEHGWRRSPDDHNWPQALAALHGERGDAEQAELYQAAADRLRAGSGQE